MEIGQKLNVSSRTEWRRWLSKNGATKKEIWLVLHRKGSLVRTISYDQAVEEALCYGWIDSMEKHLDDKRYVIRFTPRKPGSTLSESNKTRYRKLIRLGKMTNAGRRAIALAKK